MHHVDDPAYMTPEERATEVATKDILTKRTNLRKKP